MRTVDVRVGADIPPAIERATREQQWPAAAHAVRDAIRRAFVTDEVPIPQSVVDAARSNPRDPPVEKPERIYVRLSESLLATVDQQTGDELPDRSHVIRAAVRAAYCAPEVAA